MQGLPNPTELLNHWTVHSIGTLLSRLKEAIAESKPFCAISLGDGETIFYIHPEIVRVKGFWLPNAGVTEQMTDLKFKTLALMPTADYIFAHTGELTPQQWAAKQTGVEWAQHFHTWPLVLKHYKVYTPVVDCVDRYRMVTDGSFFDALGNARLLLIGHYAQRMWELHSDLNITGAIRCSEKKAGEEAERLVDTALDFGDCFDVALVSAGVTANYICLRLKQEGKIAIDFGSNMDKLAGEVLDRTGM